MKVGLLPVLQLLLIILKLIDVIHCRWIVVCIPAYLQILLYALVGYIYMVDCDLTERVQKLKEELKESKKIKVNVDED